MRIQWYLATALVLCAFNILTVHISSVNTFLFRRKNIHHVVNDPYQVRKDNITLDNLFGWLNMKNHIKFKLWTRKNPKLAHEIRIGNLESLHTSNFDARRLTKIIVHGYAHSANEIYLEDWIVSLRDAYLHLADLNILIIDYTLFALPLFYKSAAPDLAAQQLTEMIKFLLRSKVITLEGLHMLGFSWGAHIAGIAGWNLGGKVGRITGLDPAQPKFRLVEDNKRLDKSDAMFVDIIHTNGGRAFMEGHLGLGNPLGHADYYPNSGRAQPGCPLKWTYIYEEIECDHARSVNFFAESIVSPVGFPACRCDNWDHYVKGECPCGPDDMVFMGEHSPHTIRGKFYLFTRDKKPYGFGTPQNIQLPDIDQYDPDWNNTGYHYHILPYVNHHSNNYQDYNAPQTFQQEFANVPLQSTGKSNLHLQQHLQQSQTQNTNNGDHSDYKIPNAFWEHQATVVIKLQPQHEFSFVQNPDGTVNFKRDIIASNMEPSPRTGDRKSISTTSFVSKPAALNTTSFTKQLFSKYVNELTKTDQLSISI